MRWLLFIFFLVFVPSCKKGKEEPPKPISYCWDCILTVGYRNSLTDPSLWTYTTSQEQYCDMTEEDMAFTIHEYETKGGNYTTYKLECTKKQ
jgi:hypothetical protein